MLCFSRNGRLGQKLDQSQLIAVLAAGRTNQSGYRWRSMRRLFCPCDGVVTMVSFELLCHSCRDAVELIRLGIIKIITKTPTLPVSLTAAVNETKQSNFSEIRSLCDATPFGAASQKQHAMEIIQKCTQANTHTPMTSTALNSYWADRNKLAGRTVYSQGSDATRERTKEAITKNTTTSSNLSSSPCPQNPRTCHF